MRLWYLSHRRPAKAQASLRIRSVSPEPSLFAHMNYGSSRRVRPNSKHLAPLYGCACVLEEWIYEFWTKSAKISWVSSNEPPHVKTNKMTVLPAKTQIRLGIRPVWSVSSLFAWRKLWSLATYWLPSEDSDQTGRMSRLISVFAGRTCHIVGFVMRRFSYCQSDFKQLLLYYDKMNSPSDKNLSQFHLVHSAVLTLMTPCLVTPWRHLQWRLRSSVNDVFRRPLPNLSCTEHRLQLYTSCGQQHCWSSVFYLWNCENRFYKFYLHAKVMQNSFIN